VVIEPTVIDQIVVEFLTWCHREDIENIGIMELHLIPNACSEYSEQQIQNIVWTYRDIITQSDLLNLIRFTFELFSRMSATRDPKTFCLRVLFFSEVQVSMKQPVISKSRWMYEVWKSGLALIRI